MAGSYRPPSIPECFPMLETIADEQLANLIETDEHFGDLFQGLSEVQTMKEDMTTLRVMNKTAAEATLLREPQLAQAKRRLADSLDLLQALRDAYQSDRLRLERCALTVSTDAVLQDRQTQCAEQEAAVQTLAEVFLDGGLPADEFVPAFLEQRQRAAACRVRADKLREILTQPSPPPSPSVPQGSALLYAASASHQQQYQQQHQQQQHQHQHHQQQDQQQQQHYQQARPASWCAGSLEPNS